jgi:hypothetical protein
LSAPRHSYSWSISLTCRRTPAVQLAARCCVAGTDHATYRTLSGAGSAPRQHPIKNYLAPFRGPCGRCNRTGAALRGCDDRSGNAGEQGTILLSDAGCPHSHEHLGRSLDSTGCHVRTDHPATSEQRCRDGTRGTLQAGGTRGCALSVGLLRRCLRSQLRTLADTAAASGSVVKVSSGHAAAEAECGPLGT